ncbi:TetR family transcriptional regulator C-terminal domain-containing protein [Plantactinospora sp. DSM 117369]
MPGSRRLAWSSGACSATSPWKSAARPRRSAAGSRRSSRQIDLIERVVVEAKDLGQASASVDPHDAARSIVAQIEGRVLLAKLLNDPTQLDALWGNCLDLLQVQAQPQVPPQAQPAAN